MFSLTPRERKVIIFVSVVIFCGAILRLLNVNFSRQRVFEEIESSPDALHAKNISTQQIIINVNTASQKELEKLPGIGPEIARRIIEYRQSKSRFSMPDDLKKVKGIGDKKIELVKEHIVFN